MLVATGGAVRKRRFALMLSRLPSSSIRTTIQTPTAPVWPNSGVQWIQRGRPSPSPSSSGRASQRILAVTPRPSPSAAAKSARTRGEPPIRCRKGDCNIPGTRSDGEVNRILKDGAGRMSRYCCECQSSGLFCNFEISELTFWYTPASRPLMRSFSA